MELALPFSARMGKAQLRHLWDAGKVEHLRWQKRRSKFVLLYSFKNMQHDPFVRPRDGTLSDLKRS